MGAREAQPCDRSTAAHRVLAHAPHPACGRPVLKVLEAILAFAPSSAPHPDPLPAGAGRGSFRRSWSAGPPVTSLPARAGRGVSERVPVLAAVAGDEAVVHHAGPQRLGALCAPRVELAHQPLHVFGARGREVLRLRRVDREIEQRRDARLPIADELERPVAHRARVVGAPEQRLVWRALLLAAHVRQQVDAVVHAVFRQRQPGRRGDRRHDVERAHRLVEAHPGGDLPFPPHRERHAHPALEQRELAALVRRVARRARVQRAAVVADEDDEGVLAEPAVVERLHHAPDRLVQRADQREVRAANRVLLVGERVPVALLRLEGGVRVLVRQVEEERLALVAIDEGDRVVGEAIGQVAGLVDLSDQGGGILGSLGLMPSACMGPEKAYYEPSHGSAPDIAGKNIANPYSMIGSVAMMLENSFDMEAEAKNVWAAMQGVFADGYSTADLSKQGSGVTMISTVEFGDKVVEKLREMPKV